MYGFIENRNVRYETVQFVIAQNSGVGLQTKKEIQLDTAYDTSLGVAVYQKSGGSTKNFQIGVKQGGTILHDLSPKENWLASTSIKIADHYKPLKFYPKTNKLTLLVDLLEDNTDEAHTLYFVFVLTNENNQ